MSSSVLKNIKLRSWVSFTKHFKQLHSKINTLNFWIMLFCYASCTLIAHQAMAEELLIAVVSINGQQIKRLVGLCRETGLPFKVLPGLSVRLWTGIPRECSVDYNFHDWKLQPSMKIIRVNNLTLVRRSADCMVFGVGCVLHTTLVPFRTLNRLVRGAHPTMGSWSVRRSRLEGQSVWA